MKLRIARPHLLPKAIRVESQFPNKKWVQRGGRRGPRDVPAVPREVLMNEKAASGLSVEQDLSFWPNDRPSDCLDVLHPRLGCEDAPRPLPVWFSLRPEGGLDELGRKAPPNDSNDIESAAESLLLQLGDGASANVELLRVRDDEENRLRAVEGGPELGVVIERNKEARWT